jgi:hypothetical protein
VDPDPDLDHEGKNNQQKREEISRFEVLDALFLGDESFSCSLDVLHESLGKKKLSF